MNIREIKKGDKILHSHMGSNPPVSGIVKESPIVGRGVRSTLLVLVKGSEVGLFDEIGSIYTKEIFTIDVAVLLVLTTLIVVCHPSGLAKNA